MSNISPLGRAVAWGAVLGSFALGAPLARAQSAAHHDHDALTAELRALAASSPAATLGSLGRSIEGRDVWLLTIGDPGGAPLDDRPGLLVVAGLSGDHLAGSALALGIARHLLSDDEEAAETRAERVVYVVPRVNSDAAEARFGAVRWARRGNAAPWDDDNDGRVDEDGPDDLNGDGVITVMRVPDPTGDYVLDPENDRLLKKVDRAKGESGAFAVYWEGRDDDGDGFYNEDGPGGVDLDRNFQHAYPYWQADAGPHMVSEPESRALMDFVIARRNIAAILELGHSDNLATGLDGEGNPTGFTTVALDDFAHASNAGVFELGDFSGPARRGGFGGGGFFFGGGFFGGGDQLRGAQKGRDNDPSSGQRPATSVHADDRPYFARVTERYKEIVGVEGVALRRAPAGAFFQYGYFQFGVPSFSTPGWAWAKPAPEAEVEGEGGEGEDAGGGEAAAAPAAPQRPPGPPPGMRRGGRGGPPGGGGGGNGRGGGAGGVSATPVDADLLAALEAAGVDAFVPWMPFTHPQLGEVEIGGFRPYAPHEPPADRLAELGEKHGRFAVALAGMLPRVRFVDTGVTDHGGGVFTVEAEIENAGYFPSALRHGVISDSVHPVTVQIQVPSEDLLTGDAKTATFESLPGSGAREKLSWVIRGREGESVTITLRAQKGGRDQVTVVLR
jgi:hypothetical protein